jgi:CelD/BcsL family acetyltransferase involved in cellulose biosynthesis
MKYRLIEDIEEFRAISDDWDEAVNSSRGTSPFLLSGFVDTWWRHYSNNRMKLRIFVIYDGERIAGGLPLFLRRGEGAYGFAGVLSHVGGPVANYTEPFYANAGLKMLPLIGEALAKKKDWDVLYLSDVRPDNFLINECRDPGSEHEFNFHLVQDHMNFAIDLTDGQDRYMSTVSGKLKRDLRSKRAHLASHFGKPQLREIRGKNEVMRYFDLYVRFSREAFKGRNRNSNFENSKYTDFFRDFLMLMDENQRLDAHVLAAGDKILAISFGYRFGRGFNWILTGFDYVYKNYRPGYLLIEELIKEICRRGETMYNWYGHDRFYKSQWCNQRTPLYRLFIMKRTLKGACYGALRNMEDSLRSNKVIVNFVRKAKQS